MKNALIIWQNSYIQVQVLQFTSVGHTGVNSRPVTFQVIFFSKFNMWSTWIYSPILPWFPPVYFPLRTLLTFNLPIRAEHVKCWLNKSSLTWQTVCNKNNALVLKSLNYDIIKFLLSVCRKFSGFFRTLNIRKKPLWIKWNK